MAILLLLTIAFVWTGIVRAAADLHRALAPETDRSYAWPGYWLIALGAATVPVAAMALLTLFPSLNPGLSWPTPLAGQAAAEMAAPVALAATDLPDAGGPAGPLYLLGPDQAGLAADEPRSLALIAATAGDILPRLAPVLGLAAGLVWLAGAVYFGLRLGLGLFRVRRIIEEAVPSPLGNAIPVRLTDRAMTPFAATAPLSTDGPVIILPRLFLDQLPEQGCKAIIAHEAAHIARRDPVSCLSLSALGTVFWFSPFLRSLIEDWRLSAELACDDAALRGASPVMRRAYAQSLIDALRLPSRQPQDRALPCPLAAFSTTQLKDEKMRLSNILTGGKTPALRNSYKMTLAGGAAAMALIGCAAAAGFAPLQEEPEVPAPAPVVDEAPQAEPAPQAAPSPEPQPEPQPAPMAEERAAENVVTVTNQGTENGGFRQVITYDDGTRIERRWEDLTPEEQAQIMVEMERAEKDILRAQQDIERAKLDMERALGDIDTMEFGLDAEERARIIADIERAMGDISAQGGLSAEEREEMVAEMREEIERLREEEVFSDAERERMRADMRRDIEDARADIENSRAEIDRELAELRRRNEALREEMQAD